LENHKIALDYEAARSDAAQLAAAATALEEANRRKAHWEQVCADLPQPAAARQAIADLDALHQDMAALQAREQQLPPMPSIPETPVCFAGIRPQDAVEQAQRDAAELSARLRMSSVEEDSVRTEPKAEKAEQRERLEAEEKAEARREAYREKLEEEQTARDERVEALREELKGEESDETGSLELDRTSALLRNYQMNNLMQDMLSAKTRGEDTRGYSVAIDALLESSQNRVTFSTEKAEAANAHRYYQQQVKQTDSVFGAVA
jgi:hypothetical protein